MCKSRTADKYLVRLPDGLRDRIALRAVQKHRSMNAEIVHRLERYTLAIQLVEDQNRLISQLSRQIEQLTQDLEHTRGQLVVENVRADVSVEDAKKAEAAAEDLEQRLQASVYAHNQLLLKHIELQGGAA
jgi:plasmid stability protein